MKTINPYRITNDGELRIVLSSNAWSGVSWLIRAKTKSHWNHAMWMIRAGLFATQGLFFTDVPFDKYFKPGIEVEIWKIKNLTPDQYIKIWRHINSKLKKPKWKTKYDFIGLIGQLFNIRFVNNPWTNYCSEGIAEGLIKAGDVFEGLNPKSSPEDIRVFMLKRNWHFECEGRWEAPKVK